MKEFFVGIFLVVLLAASALAVAPRLASITPAGGQRGTDVELRFNGQRLDDAQEVILYTTGIEVVKISASKTNSVIATLRIRKDCRLGEHQLRLRTRTGVSELRTFFVGPFPALSEVEPNEPGKAQAVPMNSTISGVIASEDIDCFSVSARKGERLSAEIEAIRLGRSALDPYLRLRDSEGNVLAKADDTSLLMQDCYLSVVVPKDGTYLIEVRDTTYGGSDAFQYRLHIGNFPRPSAVFPAGGQAGETVALKLIGDPGGDFAQEIKLPAAAQEKFGVFPESGETIAPSPNWIRVSAFPNVLEVAPNQDREHATATDILPPIALNGVISEPRKADWFRFKAKKSQALEVSVYARRLRSPLDSVLEVFDAHGKSLASNDDAAGADSTVKFTPSEDGDYFVQIKDQLNAGGSDDVYRVEITPLQPSLTLKIPEVARNDTQSRQTITVPRGNRFATLISAKRVNFSGELALHIDGLPSGMTMHADPMTGKVDAMPIVFEARADAPVTGKLLDLTATRVGDGPEVVGHFRNDVELVQGPNNTFYYGTRVDKLYVAVTEAAPFKLRIVEPKVPLVQAGTMDLKIVAERDSGFDEPINVKMIWNPPGIGSLPDITIAKDQTNAIYRLNASAAADTRAWKIAVLGSATVNGGPLYASSQLATLEIAPPYLTGRIATAAVQPGKMTNVTVMLDQRIPFEGKAAIRLLGLPEKVTAPEETISKDDNEVVFTVAVDPACAIGSHKALFCTVDITKDGEIIPHSIGSGGILRIGPPKKLVASAAGKTKAAAKENPRE